MVSIENCASALFAQHRNTTSTTITAAARIQDPICRPRVFRFMAMLELLDLNTFAEPPRGCISITDADNLATRAFHPI